MGLFPGDFLGDALGFGGGGGGGFDLFGGGGGDDSSGLLGGIFEGLFGSFTPAKVPPRDLYGEAAGTFAVNKALAPDVYGLESQYRPQYANLEQGIVTNAARTMPGQVDPAQAALLGEMNNQALSELKLGATLDPSLAREVSQSVRGGQAARGLALGPANVYQEAMQIGSAGQALRNQRRAFAGQVAGTNLANITPYLGLGAQFAQAGPKLFDIWNPYASDLYNTNFNAANAREIAAAANRASVAGALLGSAGKIGGAMLGGG
jgi:hypothetical protein